MAGVAGGLPGDAVTRQLQAPASPPKRGLGAMLAKIRNDHECNLDQARGFPKIIQNEYTYRKAAASCCAA